MNSGTVSILLVEDDDVDAEAIQRGFRKQKIVNPIIIARNGLEALSYLRGKDGKEKIQEPFIILLDINMPRMNGHEFLKELRADTNLHKHIVFVLTTSDAETDIEKAYGHNVAGYIVKSRAGTDFVNLIELMDHYWKYIELPPRSKKL